MDKNYIYIIRRREHVILDEKIYKIGYSTEGIKKLMKYDDGLGIEVYGIFPVYDSKEVLKSILDLFDDKYKGTYNETGSLKSYNGDIEDMVKDIKNIISSCNVEDKNINVNRMRDRFIQAIASGSFKKTMQLTDKCIELGLQDELFNRNELLCLIDICEKNCYHHIVYHIERLLSN